MSHLRPLSSSLCVFASGERDRRGRCRNSSGHLHQTTVAGLCVQGEVIKGTNLINHRVDDSFGHVNICLVCLECQLVEVRGRPRMKISEDPEKSTVPGRKAVYRLVDAEGENKQMFNL